MYIIKFTSDSGHYVLGPWPKKPTTEQVMDLLDSILPAESEHSRTNYKPEEIGLRFRPLKLENKPSLIHYW